MVSVIYRTEYHNGSLKQKVSCYNKPSEFIFYVFATPPSKLSFLLIIHSKMKEQSKILKYGVNASIDKWSMLSARRKKRLMIRSATVVRAVVTVWRVHRCTKSLTYADPKSGQFVFVIKTT